MPPARFLVLLLALTFVGLSVMSRPALALDGGADTALRAARVRNILAATTGGLLLHLSAILQSLASTSSLRSGFTAGAAGWVDQGTSFAALGPALSLAALLTLILGLALWFSVLLRTLPARTCQLIPSVPA